MSAGLAASTVTPGSTAPDVSFTVPAMALVWAAAAAGSDRSNAAPKMKRANVRMRCLLLNSQYVQPIDSNVVHSPCPITVARFQRDSGPISAQPRHSFGDVSKFPYSDSRFVN